MNQRIIYPDDQGGVAVIFPVENCGLTIEEIAAKDVPAGKPFKIIDAADVPSDRTFRNAWKANGSKIEHDMAKCREIMKDRLRAERAPLLAAQDVAFQRALETNSKTDVIVAEKQRLRDITKLVDAATSLEDLKALKAQS